MRKLSTTCEDAITRIGSTANVYNALSQRDRLQCFAALKGTSANSLYATGNSHRLKCRTIPESKAADNTTTVNNGQFFQRDSTVKRIVSHLGNLGTYRHLLKICTAGEGVAVNGFYRVGNGYRLQTGTPVKAVTANLKKTFVQFCIHKTCTAPKGVAVHVKHATWELNGL